MVKSQWISILVEDEHTAVMTLNRPPANAMNTAFLEELDTNITRLNTDQRIKTVVIVSGLNKFFVVGADIGEMETITTQKEGTAFSVLGQKVFHHIESASKPYIAAIEGHCLGGGCELAMACHMRIAGSGAHFGQPEIKLGLMPGFGGTQRLSSHVGRARALEMMLTGKTLNAAEAEAIGLVNQVVRENGALETALSVAKEIQSKGANAVAAILKSTPLSPPEGYETEAAAFGSLFPTRDAREGMRAFLEKRLPKFD